VRQLVWLDLCSGLGGASQPALDRGWKVIRVDIDPRFKPDVVADLLNPDDLKRVGRELSKEWITVAWASPVCTEFTKSTLPKTWAATWKNPPKPSTALTTACTDLFNLVNPDWWIIENVMGARKFLTPILGPVAARVCGHVFWGRLPGLIPDAKSHKWRLPPTPDRTALRAKIPYEIGEAICAAVERRESEATSSPAE
jgi:hypothetical protein